VTARRAGQARAEAADAAEPPASGDGDDLLALAHPDWLYHHVLVAGDADLVTLFRHAAAGPGAIPWADDLARAEEDWFHLLAALPDGQKRSVSLHGARILAGQLREAVERRRSAAVARAGRGRRWSLPARPAPPPPRAGRGAPARARPPAGAALAVGALGHHLAAPARGGAAGQ
jgi:hypothetical protein